MSRSRIRVYEVPEHHQLDGPAISEPFTRSDVILQRRPDADINDAHIAGSADGISHEAMAACVEPVTPGGYRSAERARRHILRTGHPALLDVNIQLV